MSNENNGEHLAFEYAVKLMKAYRSSYYTARNYAIAEGVIIVLMTVFLVLR